MKIHQLICLLTTLFVLTGCTPEPKQSAQELLAIEQQRALVAATFAIAKPYELVGDSQDSDYSGPLRAVTAVANDPINPIADYGLARQQSASDGTHLLVLLVKDIDGEWLRETLASEELATALKGWWVHVALAEDWKFPKTPAFVIDPPAEGAMNPVVIGDGDLVSLIQKSLKHLPPKP